MIYFMTTRNLFEPDIIELSYSADLTVFPRSNTVKTNEDGINAAMQYAVKHEIKHALSIIFNDRKGSIFLMKENAAERIILDFFRDTHQRLSVREFALQVQNIVIPAFKTVHPKEFMFYYQRYKTTLGKVEKYVKRLIEDSALYTPVNASTTNKKVAHFATSPTH